MLCLVKDIRTTSRTRAQDQGSATLLTKPMVIGILELTLGADEHSSTSLNAGVGRSEAKSEAKAY